ncbi:MAG: hypothetical protein AOA65_1910 [Candidatus Bathyarchaeota archaeon BA1]|nr:MAG: hypothetical protein AOA65_1910 [Candidatus Bathyarchaeota archaeon BA1]
MDESKESKAEGPSNLERRVGLLEEDFRYVRSQIDAIKNDIGEIKVGLARLDERVGGLEGVVKGLQSDVKQLRSDMKWVIALIIVSILIPILLKLVFK